MVSCVLLHREDRYEYACDFKDEAHKHQQATSRQPPRWRQGQFFCGLADGSHPWPYFGHMHCRKVLYDELSVWWIRNFLDELSWPGIGVLGVTVVATLSGFGVSS